MNLTELVTDPYNRRARLQPALLAILPVVAVALILYPGLESKAVPLVGIFAYFGGAGWLTQVGRERGKRLEKELFAHWGGMPSVALLRHRDDAINKTTKARYHAFLSAHVQGLRIPGPDDEAQDPSSADEVYASATDWLLSRTRDKQTFRLVFEENMNYGYRRNLWALRPIAIAVDIVLIATVIGLHITVAPDSKSAQLALHSPGMTALAVTGAHLALILAATKDWVHTAGQAYARQLVAACDTLGSANDKRKG
jgi:hypothetical protein